MSKIEIGRWSEQLRRMLGMAGVDRVAGDLSPEISPVIVLENPTVDLLFLKGVRQCFGGHNLAAAGGFTSKWRLRNPTGSGVIAVINWLTLTPDPTTNLRVAVNEQTVNLTVVLNTTIPDARWNALNTANPQSTLVLSASNAQATGPAGDLLVETQSLANVEWMFPSRFPLLPGVSVDFGTSVANVAARMWVEWTERAFPVLEQ